MIAMLGKETRWRAEVASGPSIQVNNKDIIGQYQIKPLNKMMIQLSQGCKRHNIKELYKQVLADLSRRAVVNHKVRVARI